MIWADIVWQWPWAFAALPLPLLVWFVLPVRKPQARRALKVPDLSPFAALQSDPATARSRRWDVLLLSILWVFLILALARPQSFGEAIGVPSSGRDLLLGIDISGSMRESDLYAGNTRATRMAVVKQVASEFVARRQGDRIGLIMFGSQAYVQTPLTHDHATVQHFLGEAAVGLAGRLTAIGDAIGLGVKRLRDRQEGSRVLILLTDGENSAGVIEPEQAARLATENGVRVHTIGVGAESGDSVRDILRGGRRSELDERSLQSIARITGGRYFRARSQQELESIYREIDRLEPTLDETRNPRPRVERFAWPLALALLLSLPWAIMNARAAGRRYV